MLLRAERLSVARGRHAVVHEVSFELERGELVALLGPNGAGKSSLLDCLSGTLPAASGALTCSGRVAIALQAAELARRSVLTNIELALAWWGVPRGPERRTRALAALRSLGVAELADRPALSLSGGERRRVHLARALAVEPDVLLLDEPFAGLDPESRSRLLADAAALLRSPARATLIVVHDRAEAFALADRLLVMIGGRLVATGPPRTVLESPPSAEVARFLGYDGELRDRDGLLLTRPTHVHLDPAGELEATVSRAVPLEDGVRLELKLAHGAQGVVYAVAQWPGPAVGETVRLRLTGGCRA